VAAIPEPAVGAIWVYVFIAWFEGLVVQPCDAFFDTLRRTWNFRFDRHPGLIAVCASVADVQRTVSFAAEHDILLAVRSGGHSLAGFSSCDGGIVLDTSELSGVSVDVAGRLAEISPGTTVGGVDAELSKYGLATPGAGAATVGFAGFATGGGRGSLSARYGLACDNIQAFDIVTADGTLRTVSAETEPELFWGVRGGGGNFGVVTRFAVRVHTVPEVVAGRVVFPFNDASTAMKRIRDLLESVPDDLYVAPILAGTAEGPTLVLSLLYCGPTERADAVIGPYRAVGSPVLDTVSVVPYLETQGWFPGPPRGTATEGCTGFFPAFTDEVIDAMVASASAGPAAFALPSFSMHGAMADADRDTNAYPLREKGVDFFAMGFWNAPGDREGAERWALDLWTSVASAAHGAFVNGIFDQSLERARSAYRDKYDRLARVKATYDPTNLFSQNVNVLPAG
jgi:FAD/FMN-containing dehydrogenase